MMRLSSEQIATLRRAVLDERQRDLVVRLQADGVADACPLADAVMAEASAMGLRTSEDAYRVATILAVAPGAPGFEQWRAVLVAVLYNSAAPPGDRLRFIEREVVPRLRASPSTERAQ